MAEAKEAQFSHNTPTTLVHDPIEQPAPTATNQSALLTLPPELLNRIVYHLPRHGDSHMLSLMKTCSTLYRLLRHDMVVTFFKDEQRISSVFCLEDAHQGKFGWRPFTIINAQYGEKGEAEADAVQLTVVEHPLELFEPKLPTSDYLIIQVTAAKVWVDAVDVHFWDSDAVQRGWESIVRGCLVKATPQLVKERFPCPECKGSRRVLCGSKKLSLRWPCIDEHPKPYMAQCPRCTIYAQSAYSSHAAFMREYSRYRD